MKQHTKKWTRIVLTFSLLLVATVTWAGSPAQPTLSKQEQKVQKFLQSKVGKWVVKKAVQAAVKKHNKLVKKAQDGNLKAQQKLAKIDDLQKQKALSGDVKLGIILIAVGAILTVLRIEILAIIGIILVIVGVVLILLGIL